MGDDVVAELYVVDGLNRPYRQNLLQLVEERFFFLADRGIAELYVADLGGRTEDYQWDKLVLGTESEYEAIIRGGLSFPNSIAIRNDKARGLIKYFSGLQDWSVENRGDYMIFRGVDINQHPDPIDRREYLEQLRLKRWWS